MKKSLILLLSLMLIASGCGSDESSSNEEGKTIQNEESQKEVEEKKELSYGDTFVFDEFEMVISDSIEWTTLDNPYSELDGADIALIPVHIKNNSDETGNINMFYIKLYGSKGTELEDVAFYFDNILGYNGDLRPQAEADAYLAVVYDGDGDYYVEFDDIFNKCEVKLPISK